MQFDRQNKHSARLSATNGVPRRRRTPTGRWGTERLTEALIRQVTHWWHFRLAPGGSRLLYSPCAGTSRPPCSAPHPP